MIDPLLPPPLPGDTIGPYRLVETLAERCAAMERWAAVEGNQQYKDVVISSMNVSYERFHGEQFCDRFSEADP